MLHIDEHGRLIRSQAGETLCVEAWGQDALRIRAVRYGCQLDSFNGALLEKPQGQAHITISGNTACIANGKIRAEITSGGKLIFYNDQGKKLLEEYARNRHDTHGKDCSALELEGRTALCLPGLQAPAHR